MTTETIMVGALRRGISLSDFNEMTVGMIVGYITEWNNLNLSDDEKEETVRDAEQADFDAF